MATVINNPNAAPTREVREVQTTGEGLGTGFIVGLILVVLLLALFFVYGLPSLRGRTGTNAGVPGRVDVNVNRGGGTTGGQGY